MTGLAHRQEKIIGLLRGEDTAAQGKWKETALSTKTIHAVMVGTEPTALDF